MPRGKKAKEGDTRVAANGYHYTKVEGQWRLTHHLLAEEKLGRPLKDNERVYFMDNDRENLDPDNILVRETRNSKQDRVDYLRSKIREYQDELRELER